MTAEEFANALTRLLRSSRLANWPRRQQQRDLLVASVALMFHSGRDYSEVQANEVIQEWLGLVGKAVQIDHVNIRRVLVDTGHLERDVAGSYYRLGSRLQDAFGESIAALDIRPVLTTT